MKCSIKNMALPYRGEPTRAAYKKPVVGDWPPGMRVVEIPSVYNPKPAPIPKPRPKKKVVRATKFKGKKREVHQKPRFWTKERVDVLIDLHNQGLIYADIAERLGTTKNAVTSQVNRLINEGVLEPRGSRAHWSQEDLDMLMELKAKGLSMGEIADRIGRSPKTCSEQYRRQNVKQDEMRDVFRRVAGGGKHDRGDI